MPKQVQHRRGTTAQHATFTGALGEITMDTDKKTAVVHDGVTAGGVPLRKEVSLHLRPMDSISVDTTFPIAVNAEHYSFHANMGTTEASRTATYDITGIPGFGRAIFVFITVEKGPTSGAFSQTINLKINGGASLFTITTGLTTLASVAYVQALLIQHPVSGLWKYHQIP